MEARLSFGDKHEIIYTYAADGRKLRAEYRINNFAVVDRDDEFGEMDDIGLPLSDVATFGLRDTMVAGGGIIDLPDVPPFTTLTTRDYCGNYIYRNGVLERILTPTGYIEGDTLHHYIKDYQGNVRCVVRHDGTLVESNEYYPYGGLFSATASTQPYKYGSKELDRTNGLDLYDSEARWYDSLLGRTTTMDPLAEKYYSISPYAWCAGNPVKYVDPDGCEPTKDEAAAIAAHVYGDQDKDILIGGWQVSKLKIGIKYDNTASGFKSQLYERVVDGVVTEYVYATAGSDNDVRDWIANVTQLTGLSYQYLESGRNAIAISDALSDKELNFVGHSLGGGEAALNSILTSSQSLIGRKAITFNAAGVSNATKFLLGGITALTKPENNITAYITITDPLNNIQNNNTNIIGKKLPDVNGKIHYICPKEFNGHSIMNFLK